MTVQPHEGHGKNDGHKKEEMIEVQKCRHGFPKYPVPESVVIRKFSDEERNNTSLMKKAKQDLEAINKFLLRQTQTDVAAFEKMSFLEFLHELGMTKGRYLFALKGVVRQTFLMLPKRECSDVFVNNYNPRILSDICH